MIKKILFIIPLFLGGIVYSQSTEDSLIFKKISDEILVNGKAYEDLRHLTKKIGNRLSGSKNYEDAVTWSVAKLKEAGAEKVWLQEVTVPVWVRGDETLKIKVENRKWEEFPMLSLGDSEGTDGKDLTAQLIVVKSFEEFEKLPPADVKGKVVFFNYAFRQEFVETGQAYGDAGKYRRNAPVIAAKKGAKAVIIRSLTSAFDDAPHTGTTRYEDGVAKIPAVAIGAATADRLEAIAKSRKKIQVNLNSNCGKNGSMVSHNVIAEIKGKTDSIILVGAHLDSWDVGEGAHDDGAGVVQSIEVLRTFKKLGVQPNHTLRVVLFANEENGVKGGITYAEHVKKTQEPHIFALESDAGGFSPRGFGLQMASLKRSDVFGWKKLFLPYGAYDFSGTFAGVDIGPLAALGVPAAGLKTDPQRYFDIHHTPNDVFEAVNRRELLLGAVVMTQLMYIADKNWP